MHTNGVLILVLKTKCMIIGYLLISYYLLNTNGKNVSSMYILGVLKNSTPVNDRIQKWYRSFYSLRNVGFSYPGVHSDVKSNMWKTMCQPVLDRIVSISVAQILKLWKPPNVKIITQSLGLSKYSRNTNILQAQNSNKVSHNIIHNTLSRGIDCSVLNLLKYYVRTCMQIFSTGNTYCPMKSPLYRIVDSGCSPLICA